MKKINKENISQEVFDLYDDYAHSRIGRRQFLDKLSMYAVGGITVASLMSFLMPDYQNTLQVSQDDARLETTYITYNSPKGGGEIKGLLAKPAGAKGKLPGVLVIHENRGLNPYIEDVCRRAALAGFISIAPDALTPLGGYPGTDDEGRALQSKRDRNEMLEDFIAGAKHLMAHEQCTGKVGIVGFCFGGWVSNMMAVKVPELSAAVPFYGSQPPLESVPEIKVPLMLHYGELDANVNKGKDAYEAALKAQGKSFESFVYPGVNHGFHNDSTPRFDKPAAELAWERTIRFFKENLG